MDQNSEIKHITEKIKNFSKQRKAILALPPEKALERLLDAPEPAALVHSFPEEDLYLLIHDIGPEDSLALLSLASDRQWEYILDLEGWEKDKIGYRSLTRWLDLLLKADPNRLIKWFLKEKTEFIEFYLFKNIEVRIREHDQDPSDFGEEFFTFDHTYYVRIIDYPFEPKSDHHTIESKTEFLHKFFEYLAAYDHFTYQQVLLETQSIIPAESEEEAYRLRNIRLAEKGFLPFEEAVGIYQPINLKALQNQSLKFISATSQRDFFLPVPFYPVEMLKGENLFQRALQEIDIGDVLEQIQTEFAGLCNRIIAADQKKIRNQEELRSIVTKACGYLSIGLERITQKVKPKPNQTASVIQQYPLHQIFRLGYAQALELKWRAERWIKKSWFSKEGLPLSFWDEEWMGIIGGLLIKKPLYYDNYKTGLLYRDFFSTNDIKETDTALNEIIAVDNLLSLMKIRLENLSNRFLTYKNLILTLWARHYLAVSEEIIPLSLDEFKRFYGSLWPNEDRPRKISLWMKEAYLNWFSGATGLDTHEISQRLRRTFENIFTEIESEYGEVSEKNLDPRFINLFLIKKPEKDKGIQIKKT
ncbi:MAG: hypothetical protein JW786_14420 [Desulfobacterales bacterium]|nr:hypothetical protein [Desulfobacterales bacterium]